LHQNSGPSSIIAEHKQHSVGGNAGWWLFLFFSFSISFSSVAFLLIKREEVEVFLSTAPTGKYVDSVRLVFLVCQLIKSD